MAAGRGQITKGLACQAKERELGPEAQRNFCRVLSPGSIWMNESIRATFKITKLKKKGKYTATAKYSGNKYYTALSKSAKITVLR